MVMPDSDVERVLVVAAHPDDIDFGAAGTIAHWTAAGLTVTYCVCTDGQSGGFDVDVPREHMPEIRRAEQVAAAATVGVADVRFLGYVDGELEASRELVRDLVRVIRQVQPQRMLVPSPERWWERLPASHPDHLAAGEAAIRALYPFARNPFAFPELLGTRAWPTGSSTRCGSWPRPARTTLSTSPPPSIASSRRSSLTRASTPIASGSDP
jgi:LmbE family N-acetylglucosaminyl deacetylase